MEKITDSHKYLSATATEAARETVGAWLAASEEYRNFTAQILREHRVAGRKLTATVVNLPHSQPRWSILPLPAQAGVMLAARARYARTHLLRTEFDAFLKLLSDGGARAYRDVEAFSSPQFTNHPHALRQAKIAGEFLVKLAAEGKRIGFTSDAINLRELQRQEEIPDLQDALEDRFNLAALLSISDTDESVERKPRAEKVRESKAAWKITAQLSRKPKNTGTSPGITGIYRSGSGI
ncbi:hypothetical protein RQN30_05250 [Arcanobacterium hippocoleae]